MRKGRKPHWIDASSLFLPTYVGVALLGYYAWTGFWL